MDKFCPASVHRTFVNAFKVSTDLIPIITGQYLEYKTQRHFL
jgi:hypothetical protein